MADIKKGNRFLNNVGNFTFIDNRNNQTIFSGSLVTSYAIELSKTSNDVRAGQGNPLVMRNYTDSTLQITLTIQEWNLAYVAASVGSPIEYGLSEIFEIEKSVLLDGSGRAVLDKIPVGEVSVRLPDGRRVSVEADVTGVIDLSRWNMAGNCVFVTYPFQADAKSVLISASNDPWIGRLIIEGVVTDTLIGRVGTVQVDVPAFSLDGNLSITLNNDGTTSETSMVGVALATDGTTCLDGMVYGYVKEFIEDDVAPQIIDIIASPSPIELTTVPEPSSARINTIGFRGSLYSDVGLLPEELTYEVADPYIATVNAEGIVTAVASGETTILVTHTESQLDDSVDVVVTDDGTGPTPQRTVHVSSVGGNSVDYFVSPSPATEGATVSIGAGANEGYVFDGWTVTSGSVTFANPASANTTFIMPGTSVAIVANWVEAPPPTSHKISTETPTPLTARTCGLSVK